MIGATFELRTAQQELCCRSLQMKKTEAQSLRAELSRQQKSFE